MLYAKQTENRWTENFRKKTDDITTDQETHNTRRHKTNNTHDMHYGPSHSLWKRARALVGGGRGSSGTMVRRRATEAARFPCAAAAGLAQVDPPLGRRRQRPETTWLIGVHAYYNTSNASRPLSDGWAHPRLIQVWKCGDKPDVYMCADTSTLHCTCTIERGSQSATGCGLMFLFDCLFAHLPL